jgi:hypothetical protein
LTTDGTIATRQIAEYDQETSGAGSSQQASGQVVSRIQRHLSLVMPRRLAADRTSDVYAGVNPPAGDPRLPAPARIELRISAVGGAISPGNLWLDVPTDAAAVPGKFSLTPARPGQTIRVRVDAFQMFALDQLEPLGGMYFDVQVSMDSTSDPSRRAVGMDILLNPAH